MRGLNGPSCDCYCFCMCSPPTPSPLAALSTTPLVWHSHAPPGVHPALAAAPAVHTTQGLAACTGGERPAWTSAQTSQSSAARPWRWCAPGSSPSWIFPAPWSTWRRRWVEDTEWSATGTGQRPAKLHASPYRQRQLLHLSPKAALSVTCTKCQLQLPVATPALLASFTQGVCVAALGSDEFPAFFTPHSGCRAPFRVESPAQAAAMVDASRRLGLEGGMVLGEPCCLLVWSPFHCADTCDTEDQARRADEKAACWPLHALLLQHWAG